MAVRFRNIVRYVRNVNANVPLYEAIGFRTLRTMGDDMAIMQNDAGLKLVLHTTDEPEPAGTVIGVEPTGDLQEARQHLEASGFRLLRAPQGEDVGFFFIYGDLDGNPVNLVGQRPQ